MTVSSKNRTFFIVFVFLVINGYEFNYSISFSFLYVKAI